jgi:alpha-1,6-mannosyltransferase
VVRPESPLSLAAWLVGTALMVIAWWSVGRSATAPSLSWVLTTVAFWAAPLALAPPLGSRDVYFYACQGAAYAAGLEPLRNRTGHPAVSVA